MTPRWQHSRKFFQIVIILSPLVAGLIFITVVTATPSPAINTNDGLVDPNWGAPIFTSNCSNSGIPDISEIKSAWVQNNSTNMYFRIQTCAAPAIGSGLVAVAALDCDQTGNTNTQYDRLITYNPSNDYQYIRDGTTFGFGSNCPGSAGSPCEYGERVNAPDDSNVEWRMDYSGIPNETGSAFPPGCRDQINIAFAIANASTGVATDSTPLKGWNVPTIVDIKEIKVTSKPDSSLVTVGLLGFVLVGVGLVVVLRRRRK